MQAEAIQHIDNEHVRVTEFRFAPGAATGFHRHGYDYVITPVTDGVYRIVDAEGNETRAEMKAGVAYFRSCGVEHDVISAGDGPQSFVEVEVKSREG